MKSPEYSKNMFFTAAILVLLSLFTTLLNIHAYTSVKAIEKQLVISKSLTRPISNANNHLTVSTETEQNNPNTPVSSEAFITQPEKPLSPEEEIERLSMIIQLTGLETLAEMNKSYPGILREMLQERIDRLNKVSRLSAAYKNHGNQLPNYKELNKDAEYTSLVKAYSMAGRPEMTEQDFLNGTKVTIDYDEKEKALEALIRKYPDYLTVGQYMYTFTFTMARQQNIQKAEKYYNKTIEFIEKKPSMSIFTGEAGITNLELQLAYMYYQAGDSKKLNSILDKLETEYPDDLIVNNPARRNQATLSEMINFFRVIKSEE